MHEYQAAECLNWSVKKKKKKHFVSEGTNEPMQCFKCYGVIESMSDMRLQGKYWVKSTQLF